MMKRSEVGFLAVICGLLVATVAAAADTVPLRSFSRFELDSGTVRGLWGEVGAAYSERDWDEISSDLTTVAGRIAYGGENAEAGLILPYHDVNVDVAGFGSNDEDGIGDIRMYGKVVPIRTELIDLGAGLDMSLPSGDEDDGLGEGEVGFLPFVTGAVHLGTVDARGHFGYRFFADRDKWESFHYGFGLYGRVNEMIALRTEFNALVQKARGPDLEPWQFEPGVDVRIPAGEGIDFLVRPTGMVGMNDDAPDWGIGGSVVLTWLPPR